MSGSLRAADHAERLNYAIHRGPNAGIAKANAVWGPILVRMQSLPRECCSRDAAFRLPSHREFFDTTYGPLKAQPATPTDRRNRGAMPFDSRLLATEYLTRPNITDAFGSCTVIHPVHETPSRFPLATERRRWRIHLQIAISCSGARRLYGRNSWCRGRGWAAMFTRDTLRRHGQTRSMLLSSQKRGNWTEIAEEVKCCREMINR